MNILIVESKAKCKTLLKHLGKDDWRVLPTGGHVERLPNDRKLHPPKEVRKAYWSHRPGQLPEPPWFWTERGEAALDAIKAEAAKHDTVAFYLAADPDREGERIAWHLEKLLSDVGPCHRVTFQEITKPAVRAAVAAPHDIDRSLVDAALIRTFVDRVVGWRASKIARRYTTSSTDSMGRVQTPTLGFVVDRELEREAHVPVRYFEVLATTAVTRWQVRFHERSDAAVWVDDKGRIDVHRTADAPLAGSAHAALVAAGRVEVTDVTRRQKSQRPPPPFSTDALLQAAGSRWGWSPGKTSALAGQLYEAGQLTYIRTDSTRLAAEAVQAARAVIARTWGDAQLGDAPGAGSTATPAKGPAAGVQDAHEAIRPTRLDRAVVPDAEPDVQKLYALVRAQTLGSLMVPSLRVTLSLRGSCDGLDRPLDATVGWYAQPGWRHAFQAAGLEAADAESVEVTAGTTQPLVPGDADHPNPELKDDETKPPARYRAHSLVKAMKEAGIGRPSSYAKTVERLEERGYVTLEDNGVAPTQSGRNIWLEAAPLFVLPDQREVFQTEYTAAMEELLDDVSEGRQNPGEVWEVMLQDFKSAHAAAQQANKTGPLLPRTRRQLAEYVEAEPTLADELGDLDALGAMTEEQGRAWLADLRTRGITLLPTEKQQNYMERLLQTTDLTLAQALESAELIPASAALTRAETTDLIDHLSGLEAQRHVPSPRQLRWIADLARKANLEEPAACALVGLTAYAELTGGREGTASALIDALRPLAKTGKPTG